ncbi:MAG: carboxypeptidase-like regulatory domain-containing protein [Bacteroidales bacterium]
MKTIYLIILRCIFISTVCVAQKKEDTNIKTVENPDYYTITGKITDNSSGRPVPYVNVYISSLGKGAISDTNGIYHITMVKSGNYEIKFSFIGYKDVVKYIQLSSETRLNVTLEVSFNELESVIVTPGIYNIATAEPTMSTLSSREILQSPNFAKDINRSLRVIPGFANNDVSAKPRIRGGHWDETATYIDNFEIYEPYHFEETDGLASIFNTDNAKNIIISTGGFSARYTDKMSGIIEVKTPEYVTKNQISASIDFLNASVSGKLKMSDKTSILYGFRRGYLDMIMNATDTRTKISPVYYDIWCKVNYQINPANILSLNFLKAKNDFNLTIPSSFNENTYFHNIKNNNYCWMNWKWLPGKNYYALTTLGYQDLYANSDNHFIQSITADNTDKRLGQLLIMTQNHLWNITPNNSLEFGFELKKFQEFYRFNETRYDLYNSTPNEILIDTIDVNSHINGFTFASFIQDTWSITKKINILPGIRLSRQSYSGSWYMAPRLAVSAELLSNLNLRIAYGIYYQPDNFEKLKSFEGQSTPLSASNECIQYTSSLDYKLNNTTFKIEIYYKDYLHLTDDFRYDVYNRIPFIIDQGFGTVSGKSRGMELTWRQKYGKNNIVTVSYVYAKNTIRNGLGQETYRNFDRRHTVTINDIQNLPRNWSASFLLMFHTGEPYTPYNISFIGKNDSDQEMYFFQTQVENSGRLPSYNTLDFRIAKTWNFRKLQMNIYLNIVNLFNSRNITGYGWSAWQNSTGQWFVSEYQNSMNIPRFISPGISLTF